LRSFGQHGLEGRPGRLDADADGHEQGQEPVVGLDPQRDAGVGREVEGEDVLAGGRGQVEEEAGVDADPGVAAGGAGDGGRGVGVAVPGGDGPEPAGPGVDVEDEALLLVGVEPRRPEVGAVDGGEEVLGDEGHGGAGRRPSSREILLDVGVAVEAGVEGDLDAVDPQHAPVVAVAVAVLCVAVDGEVDRGGVAPVGHLPGQREGADGNAEGARRAVGRAGREAPEPVGVGGRPPDVALVGDVDHPAAQIGVAHGREGPEPVAELLELGRRDGDREAVVPAGGFAIHCSPPNSAAWPGPTARRATA
jgi:hypothetical protein